MLDVIQKISIPRTTRRSQGDSLAILLLVCYMQGVLSFEGGDRLIVIRNPLLMEKQ
jgi:hypothetical protein